MKKIAIIAALLMVFSVGSVFAVGIGVQGGYVAGNAGYGSGAVTFKLDSPWIFAVNADLYGNSWGVGLTMDNWIGNPVIEKPFRFFYGWGLAGSVALWETGTELFVGARAVAGLNCFVLDNVLEFYLQAAWQPGIVIGLHDNGGVLPSLWNFPLNAGFRFWF